MCSSVFELHFLTTAQMNGRFALFELLRGRRHKIEPDIREVQSSQIQYSRHLRAMTRFVKLDFVVSYGERTINEEFFQTIVWPTV
jgi:hypothetical protein